MNIVKGVLGSLFENTSPGPRQAYTTGTGVILAPNNTPGASFGNLTLGVSTYYIELGHVQGGAPADVGLISAHLKWALAVAGVITFETSNFPDVSPFSTTAGDWIPENPATASVSVVGAGNTSVAATVTAGGTAAGGCIYHVGNLGARRGRLKLVTSVGGALRCDVRGKAY